MLAFPETGIVNEITTPAPTPFQTNTKVKRYQNYNAIYKPSYTLLNKSKYTFL